MRAGIAQGTLTTRISLWVFLTFLPFFILITRGHFQSTDEIAVFQQARSLWDRGDVDVGPMINTRVGRMGHNYAVYGVGQSIAAAPFYGAGKWLHGALAGNREWTKTLAGPVIGADPAIRWGGEVEIFAAALFGSFVTALLCAVFLACSMQLGASVRSALVATVFFGTTSHVAGFSSTFFQHPLETLTIFSAFYLLCCDAREPSVLRRAFAGVLAGYALVVRIQTLVLLPALSAYLLWNVWRRHSPELAIDRRRVGWLVVECLPFFALIGVGIAAQVGINYFKFGELTFSGGYAGGRFDASLFTTVLGFLFSPGASVFIFTPLLILIPLYWPPFFQRHRAESLCLLGAAGSYVFFYANYGFWHGQWCFGPRYLVATVPLLLLPFAAWWEATTNRWRVAALALGVVGLFVQVLHVAVNFSYVYHVEKYEAFKPAYGYLFIPESSQLVAHYRALMAGDYRVDMWLLNIYREFGASQTWLVAWPLVVMLCFGARGLRRAIARAPATVPRRAQRELPVAGEAVPARRGARGGLGLVQTEQRTKPAPPSANRRTAE